MISGKGTTKADVIKKLITIHKNKLVSDLTPEMILVLRKNPAFKHYVFDERRTARQEKERLLSFVNQGDLPVVEAFVTNLQEQRFGELVELIDPSDLHSKAGKMLLLDTFFKV